MFIFVAIIKVLLLFYSRFNYFCCYSHFSQRERCQSVLIDVVQNKNKLVSLC